MDKFKETSVTNKHTSNPNQLSQEMLLSVLGEIVRSWDDCDATVLIPPNVGVSRLFKSVGLARYILNNAKET
jgi:hypothetical protein